jgi:hypothetical protein
MKPVILFLLILALFLTIIILRNTLRMISRIILCIKKYNSEIISNDKEVYGSECCYGY